MTNRRSFIKQVFYNNLSALKSKKWIQVAHPGFADPNRVNTTELICSPKTKERVQKMVNNLGVPYESVAYE